MFDFAPVGLVIAAAGILFVVFVGHRLIPPERLKHDSGRELANLEDYVAELRVAESSQLIGNALKTLDRLEQQYDVNVLGLIRRGKRLPGLGRDEPVRKSDLIVVEGRPEAIDQFIGAAGLTFTRGT